MKYLALIIPGLFLLSSSIKGQHARPDSTAGVAALDIKALTFVKNNEYFNPVKSSDLVLSTGLPWPVDKSVWIEGYTLTGFFFQPVLTYTLSSKVSLEAGGHFLKYSGHSQLKARPVLSASYRPSANTTLVMGTLSGSDKHKMFDPHFNREYLYTQYLEEGVQLLTHTEHIFNDAWLNWENFIFRNDTEREIFTFGESFRYTSPYFARNINIEIPLQLQFKHFGGQISDYPERVITFFNLAAGAKVIFDFPGITRAGIEYNHFLNRVIPSRPGDILSNGFASWTKLDFEIGNLSLCSSYWRAEDFYAPNGNGIYASVFDFNSGYIVHSREILAASVYLDALPEKNLGLFFGLDLYYDVSGERMDYSLALHLDFEKIFRLVNVK